MYFITASHMTRVSRLCPREKSSVAKVSGPSTHAQKNNLASVTTHRATRVTTLLIRDVARVSFSQRKGHEGSAEVEIRWHVDRAMLEWTEESKPYNNFRAK